MTNKKTTATSEPQFGLAIATSLVVGTMIGSGIFLLPASLAEFGTLGLLGWLMAATGALSLAYVFAKLSFWQPGLGGPYHFTRKNVGEFPAFLVAWGYWISVWTGNAAIAMAAVSYAKLLFPVLIESTFLATGLGLVFVWCFSAINIMGVREAGITQLITTLCKAVPLMAFAVIGLLLLDWPTQWPQWSPSSETDNQHWLGAVVAAAALWLWAFLGVESASIPANSIRDPKRTIPRATLIGILLVAVIYGLGFLVVLITIPGPTLATSNGPFAEAAAILMGGWAGVAMTVVALVSTLGALNGLILLGGQMPMAAAKDGLLPKFFAQQNKRQAPALGIFISALLTSALLLTTASKSLLGVFNFAILLSTTAIIIPYIFCSAAAFRVRMSRAKKGRWLSLSIILLAFLFSLWAVSGAGQEAVYWGFILIMLGVPVYTGLKVHSDQRPS
ncbi:MAG: amino acid permease [Gammaproteobacteria bacterium]|nr:amino acid permease [Gammaproteobacteria bacterium]